MSTFVNRIFKNKKTTTSKTMDDIHYASSTSNGTHVKTSTLPRSKTTSLNVVNGRATASSPLTSPQRNHTHNNSSGHHHFIFKSSATSSKSRTPVRSPPGGPSPVGVCFSPVEIPVEEALQLIAEDPPHVARSTPKGVQVDTKKWKEEHDMQHCMYGREVYEKMIDNSLKACEMLQQNLDSYITVVRQTPSREVTPATTAANGTASHVRKF